MKDITSIVVGIDYSENSANALREASRIANWNDATLVCLHVLDEEVIEVFRERGEFDEPGVRATALQHLEAFVTETVGAGHDLHCQICVGHPFKEILVALAARDAELLVLGSHGIEISSADRIGALANRCIRKAPVDVLLVRERQKEPFRCVVACVDFSESSIKAAHHAAEIARQDNAALELLHIFRSPIYDAPEAGIFGPLLPPIDTRGILDMLRARLDTLADEISASCGGCEVHTHVDEWAVVAGGIIRRFKELDPDLAVIGNRGRTGIKGFFVGTTAEKIIRRAPCSVLTVKPEGFRYKL